MQYNFRLSVILLILIFMEDVAGQVSSGFTFRNNLIVVTQKLSTSKAI